MVFRSHGKAASSSLPIHHTNPIPSKSSSACSGGKVSTYSNRPTSRQTTKNSPCMSLYNKHDISDLFHLATKRYWTKSRTTYLLQSTSTSTSKTRASRSTWCKTRKLRRKTRISFAKPCNWIRETDRLQTSCLRIDGLVLLRFCR